MMMRVRTHHDRTTAGREPEYLKPLPLSAAVHFDPSLHRAKDIVAETVSGEDEASAEA